MKYISNTLNVSTNKEEEMINVSSEVKQLLKESKITTGKITLFVPHTTAAITINENGDPDVKEDVLYGLSKAFPKDEKFLHYEGNSHAHIKSSLIGVEQTILVENKSMILGTWQGIYFMEFDGPRTRKLIVQISGI
jgi:secondary thiamine-phosphate synthase enzyme